VRIARHRFAQQATLKRPLPHDGFTMNTSTPAIRRAATGLLIDILDPSRAGPGAASVQGLLRDLPFAMRQQAAHIARLDDGSVVGAALIGSTTVGRTDVLVGCWPCVEARHRADQWGGLQAWEHLLRSQLWWALQHRAATVMLAAPAKAFAAVHPSLSDVGTTVVQEGVVPNLRLPHDWALVRVDVQAGLEGLRAKRLSSVLLARFTLGLGAHRS
jgi:hypothetical protein